MEYRVVKNDELYHHGILGQKWGVRRYQNSDGTLTDAGRRRYKVENVKNVNTVAEAKAYKKNPEKYKMDHMSDAEIAKEMRDLRTRNELLSERERYRQNTLTKEQRDNEEAKAELKEYGKMARQKSVKTAINIGLGVVAGVAGVATTAIIAYNTPAIQAGVKSLLDTMTNADLVGTVLVGTMDNL